MTSLLEGAKRLVSRGSDLGDRIEGLGQATEAARGRLDDRVVDEAEAAVAPGRRPGSGSRPTTPSSPSPAPPARASRRRSTPWPGVELSSVGVRRPTTSWATACVWGKEGADELLEYLGIAPAPPGHARLAARPRQGGPARSQGVVLLDLPDHDSTEVSHHLEVDRLIELADLMVWVLDPQKYADAADPRPLPRAAGRPTRT